jgi:hypothetical protein
METFFPIPALLEIWLSMVFNFFREWYWEGLERVETPPRDRVFIERIWKGRLGRAAFGEQRIIAEHALLRPCLGCQMRSIEVRPLSVSTITSTG